MKIGDLRLGFIGFGHMAESIFRAIDLSRLIPRSHVLFIRRDKQKMRKTQEEFGITGATMETLVQQSDVLILCVRPFQAEEVLKEMQGLGVEGKMVVTTLAGRTLSLYQRYLGTSAHLLRVMPNIASSVQEGMSIFTFGPHVPEDQKQICHTLFSALGGIEEVPENLMDLCTAISASGPGFIFRLIEAMAKEGELGGLTYPQALKIAAQTFLGAAKLILSGEMPQDLIHKIATPGGVTEAGFEMMRQLEVEKHFQRTIRASEAKARQMKNLSS